MKNREMTISLIAAMSQNRVIGHKGLLPWGYLPNDLDNLYQLTEGIPMIMGRKSYDTPDRVWSKTAPNIVVTRQPDYILEEPFEKAPTLQAALKAVADKGFSSVFIIGGGEIFSQSMSLSDKIYLTVVHNTFEGDVFFPDINPSVYRLVQQQDFTKDTLHRFDYSFLIYEKIIKNETFYCYYSLLYNFDCAILYTLIFTKN